MGKRETLGRRSFIELLGGGIAASTAAVWTPGCDNSNPSSGGDRVIVIGAGAAGLTIGNALTTAGVETVVLEARDRLGGRIWSDDVDGVPVDLGGMWIHGFRGNAAACILNQEGVGWELAEFYGINVRIHDSELQRELTIEERLLVLNTLSDFYDAIPSLIQTLGLNASMSQAITAFLDQADLEGDARRQVEFGIRTEIELGNAQSPGQISLATYAGDGDDGGGGDSGGDNFPNGSYRPLITALARGVDVRLNTIVSRIEHSSDGVTVETSNGTERGSHVVVTVPLGVLKAGSIAFSPALPSDKLAAIDAIGMGDLEKVVLRFDEPFWQTPGSGNILYMGASPGEYPLIVDYTPYANGQATLVAFYCGDYGETIAGMSDDAIAARAVAVVNEFAGTQGREPTAVRVTRWKADPYALGSYPSNPVLASPAELDMLGAHYEALAAPVGERLLFAGDGTSLDFGSTVEGAVVTGIREAERILGREGQGVMLDSGLLVAPGCNEQA